jgi:hypothetical protein
MDSVFVVDNHFDRTQFPLENTQQATWDDQEEEEEEEVCAEPRHR